MLSLLPRRERVGVGICYTSQLPNKLAVDNNVVSSGDIPYGGVNFTESLFGKLREIAEVPSSKHHVGKGVSVDQLRP